MFARQQQCRGRAKCRRTAAQKAVRVRRLQHEVFQRREHATSQDATHRRQALRVPCLPEKILQKGSSGGTFHNTHQEFAVPLPYL